MGHLKQDFDTGTHLSRVYLYVINVLSHCSVQYTDHEILFRLMEGCAPMPGDTTGLKDIEQKWILVIWGKSWG